MFLFVYSYVLDIIIGDPERFPHPVRWMGKLINLLDKRLNKGHTVWLKRIKGIILAFIVVGISVCITYVLLKSAKKINPIFGNFVWVYLGYTTLSVKDLQVKAKAIYREIERDDIFKARKELSRIVGRDTNNLNKNDITRATIESVSENTNDGIIAPLFYLILGGPVLAVAYKAINTLDSMVGYKNDRYLDFGWFSARLDDIANYIPARISGLLISISSFILGKGFLNSFKTMLKDGSKHSSPNSGISEAAMAGALGIRLGGGAFYQGKLIEKQYIGKNTRTFDNSLIHEASKISFLTSVLMLFTGVLFKWQV